MLTLDSAEIARWLGEFLWPFLRILALFSVAPGFGAAALPARVKVAMAFVIAAVVAPTIRPAAPLALDWVTPVLAVQQVLVGLAIGFAMQVTMAAMAFAGDLIGVQMGFGFAGLFDPQTHFEVPVMADFFGLVGLLLFVTLNGHLILLGVVVKSFAVVPVAPGGGITGAGWHSLAGAGALLFQMGVALALPVVAVLLAVTLGLAVVSRVAPQINIISVGFSLFMGIGIAAILALVPFLAPAVAHMIAAGLAAAGTTLRGG
ncbi:MAG TPA: flagellar biosynthetic protein FliR [Stellaceae bacterium]|nr:flagellar biosynthetic protein FliR [Stellaceae bacterium]